MRKKHHDAKNVKKYTKKTIKTLVIFLILSSILLLVSVILSTEYIKSDNIKNIMQFLIPLFIAAVLFCMIFLPIELFSYIKTDDEKIILPGKGALKYDDIRSVSIRFIHADKKNIAGSVLLGILLFFLSCLVEDDCMSGFLDTGKKNRYDCIFHMKNGDDIKISLQNYGIEQSREIVKELESKISRHFYL